MAPLHLAPDARVVKDLHQQLASSCDGTEALQVMFDADAIGLGMFVPADGVAVVHHVAGWGRQLALYVGVLGYLAVLYGLLRLGRRVHAGVKKQV